MDGIFAEMNRVREIIQEYEHPSLNGAGTFAATLMKMDIKRAEQAVQSGDVIQMLRAYQTLKNYDDN